MILFDFEVLRIRTYENYNKSRIELEEEPHLPTMGISYAVYEKIKSCGLYTF